MLSLDTKARELLPSISDTYTSDIFYIYNSILLFYQYFIGILNI